MRASLSLSPRRRARAAFTLLEMIIVIALIAILAGVAIMNVDKIFGSNQERIAKIFVTESLRVPLTNYRIDMGSYPSTAEGLQALITAPDGRSGRWRGPYIEGNQVPNDPWGNPYQYRFPGTRNPSGFDLYSFGPDGVDSDQNIGNW
ncbi:MAG: type II secretion system protein GspG [Puniceicoccaceae bacterium]|nr:MAG: type II secretion system protein GspG [Puniceicoccaceae bacterium]